MADVGTFDTQTDRTRGTALILVAVLPGYLLSSMNLPWWVKALGAVAMIGLTFVGFRLAFHQRQDAAPAARSRSEDLGPPG